MMRVKELQVRQRQLLHAWLGASDGGTRFAILQELRAVEREMKTDARRFPNVKNEVKMYAVR
ncbi:MAG: hypothetical protein OWU32_01465 [Firmicutes bacterium]|nr:hypothetical protein [Bacillota bacterium]